ncbi:hypothetical protein GOP47_0018861 [Adiantum capillus-veneris]|uniref:Uncharacterized protein n=1 Tax=Adiantum capillus-veneris TaxID=13818 RepID=A0A9D4UEL2_ADICA|nr:hypothetical protein GOP47_0018861 [Adiantum capillus-veneris]
MWEQILGKKIASSHIKALEDAYTEFRVSKAVPSWLPFHPNSSFWIPSYEVTLNALEELAEAFERLPSASPEKDPAPPFTASPDLIDDGISSSKAFSTIQVVDQLVDKLRDIPLEDGSKILVVDVSGRDKERNSTEEMDDYDDDDYEDTDEGEDFEDEELGYWKEIVLCLLVASNVWGTLASVVLEVSA